MTRKLKLFGIAAALWALGASVNIAKASVVTVTISGVYTNTGAAPSPTVNFSLSFNIDRTPGVCGGGTGTSILCNVSAAHYVDGTVDTMLGVSAPPTLLVSDTTNGGGLAYYQDDLALNRLYFVLSSDQLFSGPLSNPTLEDGVYSILPNAPCNPTSGCNYVSYAGQSFAAGDPINNPFHDPISLQAQDPLISGTITIGAATMATPLPAALPLFATGLGGLGLLGWRRKKKSVALAA